MLVLRPLLQMQILNWMSNGDVQARHGLIVGPTTAPKCAVDMSGVVDIVADGVSRATIAYMIPPRLTTAQRDALTDTGGNALGSDEAGCYDLQYKHQQTSSLEWFNLERLLLINDY